MNDCLFLCIDHENIFYVMSHIQFLKTGHHILRVPNFDPYPSIGTATHHQTLSSWVMDNCSSLLHNVQSTDGTLTRYSRNVTFADTFHSLWYFWNISSLSLPLSVLKRAVSHQTSQYNIV
jgi:hypothetical protein